LRLLSKLVTKNVNREIAVNVLRTVGDDRSERVDGSMLIETTMATEERKTLRCPSVQFGVDEYDPIHRVAAFNSAEKCANDQGAGWIVKSVEVGQWLKPL
jgi:hypothetical protein